MKNDLISRSELKKAVNGFFDNHFKGLVSNELITYAKAVDNAIDNAPTVEPDNEYGAIQYSNGFNDGFTTAKDTIIQNIAKQYSEHNELVPEWLSIGDLKGGAE